VEVVVAAVLGLWLVATVLHQFPLKASAMLHRLDLFHLIPRWTFFAPRPMTSDYVVIVRLLDDQREVVRDWQPISDASARTLLSGLWNPQRRLRKFRHDAAQLLLKFSRELPDDSIDRVVLTTPYLLLLNCACESLGESDAAFVQFAVVQTHGYEPEYEQRVLIRSGLHPLHA